MIASIFTDIWDKINQVFGDFYDFIMENYDKPFLWIILFGVLLLIAYATIANLTNK